MKTQLSKKLFVFIITAMMFSSFNHFVLAQKKCKNGQCPSGYDCINNICIKHTGGYFCKCGVHGYGCGGNHDCINFCVSYCGGFANIEKGNNGDTILTNGYNPDSQSASFSFTISKPEKISLKIIDGNGRLMETLTNGMFEKGEYKLVWKMTNVQAGEYYLQLDKEADHDIEKLCVVIDKLD